MFRIATIGLVSLLALAPATGLSTVARAAESVEVIAQASTNSNSGSFTTVDKNTAGGFRIVTEGGKRYLELADDFQTGRGPDLFVLLHNEAVPSSYNANNFINLGRLEKFRGAQRYEIPADADLSNFASVVIWCRQFDVTFGYAPLA